MQADVMPGVMKSMRTSFSGGALRRPENLVTTKARMSFASSSGDARVEPEHDGVTP
jgi:hypothetical protein